MKKIFVLTGEPSGDKLASKAISKLQKDYTDIEYLSVGGSNLRKIGIESIFDLKEITYLGFTSVLLNIFKINKRINETVKEVLKFNPDILFSVDSPDFTLRVAEKVKKINPQIKTIHYVAPQVWIWRKGRVNNKTDINNFISNNKKIISIFPGSRKSETNILLPILIDFINMMNKRNSNYNFIFHATEENKNNIIDYIKDKGLNNIDIISDENMKKEILSNSIFAVCKSGTISLQVCNANVPSIIIYKLNFINFMIFKLLVNVKFANIINIINNKEVIPELLQSECNAKEIYNSVLYMLKNPEIGKKQLEQCNQTLKGIRSNSSSSNEVATILRNSLVG